MNICEVSVNSALNLIFSANIQNNRCLYFNLDIICMAFYDWDLDLLQSLHLLLLAVFVISKDNSVLIKSNILSCIIFKS